MAACLWFSDGNLALPTSGSSLSSQTNANHVLGYEDLAHVLPWLFAHATVTSAIVPS